MLKKIIIFLVILLVVLIVVAVWIVSWLGRPSTLAPSPYSEVHLSTGDIYFGKLSWFPSPHLTNVWLLQRGVDAQNQQQLSFVKFSNAFWGPIDRIELNPKQIMFWTRLQKDSATAKAFENPSSLPQAEGNASSLPSGQRVPSSETPSSHR